jgi:hypothetical protein
VDIFKRDFFESVHHFSTFVNFDVRASARAFCDCFAVLEPGFLETVPEKYAPLSILSIWVM